MVGNANTQVLKAGYSSIAIFASLPTNCIHACPCQRSPSIIVQACGAIMKLRSSLFSGFLVRSSHCLVRSVAQHSVHPTGGTLRVFRLFAWLQVGSTKMALPRPAHQRVTQTVGLQR